MTKEELRLDDLVRMRTSDGRVVAGYIARFDDESLQITSQALTFKPETAYAPIHRRDRHGFMYSEQTVEIGPYDGVELIARLCPECELVKKEKS